VNLLLHHHPHVVHHQHKHQGVDQHTHLGRLALSVLDVSADQRQLAGQVVGHGVGNQEKDNEGGDLGHLVLYIGKKFDRL